jgi:hypothetical protein
MSQKKKRSPAAKPASAKKAKVTSPSRVKGRRSRPVNQLDKTSISCPLCEQREDIDFRYVTILHISGRTCLYGLCEDCADLVIARPRFFEQIERALIQRYPELAEVAK